MGMAAIRDLTTRDTTLVPRVIGFLAGAALGVGGGIGTWLLLRPVDDAAGLVGVLVGVGLAGLMGALVTIIALLAQLIDNSRP